MEMKTILATFYKILFLAVIMRLEEVDRALEAAQDAADRDRQHFDISDLGLPRLPFWGSGTTITEPIFEEDEGKEQGD